MIVRSELKNTWLVSIKPKPKPKPKPRPTQTAQKQKAMINHRLLK
jgi:hypothetical protein